MHLTVRRYENVPHPREITRYVDETFTPLISAVPGFVAYYFTDAGGGTMFSTSLFKDKAGAEESTRVAAEWVKKNPGVLPVAAQVTTGEVIGHKLAGELVGQKHN
jgi:hypothetical protein